MDHTTTILQQAYSYTILPGQTTSEIAAIRYLLISEDTLKEIGDSDLFLLFIENVVKERFNVSFPEEPELYHQYVNDCTLLKQDLEVGADHFSSDLWIGYAIKLLENLKTPYYTCYATCMHNIVKSVANSDIAERILSEFYAVIIKSQKPQLEILMKLSGYLLNFADIPDLPVSLLCDIILENLSLFGQEKTFWLNTIAQAVFSDMPANLQDIHVKMLLPYFMEQELAFTKALSAPVELSFSQYLAMRAQWLPQNKLPLPHNLSVLSSLYSETQTIDSEFLNTYAYNMNETAYLTNPAIGRDDEISDLALILISPKKSPILLGEAGVGKTSVVEGLAYKLKQGKVPDLLKNKKIFKLTTTALLSDTKYVGEMEERIKKLTRELKEHPDVILFIDEIHTIVGAGSTENSNNDISNMLKPYIDRGEIKIIGATTKDEYDAFIAKDTALSRRFYPVYISEPDTSVTLQILEGSIPSIEYTTNIRNPYNIEQTRQILLELIQICRPESQIPELSLHYPELPLTLLEMGFSYAAINNQAEFSVSNLRQAIAHSSRLKKEVRFSASTYFTI